MMNNHFINLVSTSMQHFLLQQVFVRLMSIKEQREKHDSIKKPIAMITYIIHRYINVIVVHDFTIIGTGVLKKCAIIYNLTWALFLIRQKPGNKLHGLLENVLVEQNCISNNCVSLSSHQGDILSRISCNNEVH